MRTSSRGEVDPFIVMDVMEAARAEEARGPRASSTWRSASPARRRRRARARRSLAQAMEAGPLGYTVALGLPELRARIARLYRDWYGVELDPGRVVVTAGSSAAFILAFTSLFDAASGWRSAIPAIRATATSCARSTSCRSASPPAPRTASSRCRAI